MNIQTIIVIAIVLVAAAYLVRKYIRAAKGKDGCGCGCDAGDCCPAKKHDPDGDSQ